MPQNRNKTLFSSLLSMQFTTIVSLLAFTASIQAQAQPTISVAQGFAQLGSAFSVASTANNASSIATMVMANGTMNATLIQTTTVPGSTVSNSTSTPTPGSFFNSGTVSNSAVAILLVVCASLTL